MKKIFWFFLLSCIPFGFSKSMDEDVFSEENRDVFEKIEESIQEKQPINTKKDLESTEASLTLNENSLQQSHETTQTETTLENSQSSGRNPNFQKTDKIVPDFGKSKNDGVSVKEEKIQDVGVTVITGDIKDLRPEIPIKEGSLFMLLVILVTILLFVLLFKKKSKTKRQQKVVVKPSDPYEEALKMLDKALAYIKETNRRPFAFIVSDAVRQYLSSAFQLPSPEHTTEEMLEHLPNTRIPNELQLSIIKFLQKCDLAKFTTFYFDENFCMKLHQEAKKIIDASLREVKKSEVQNEASGIK